MFNRDRVVIVALLSLAAAILLLPSILQADPAPFCVGPEACTGNTGDVGEGACIGAFSCATNSGDIAKNSCHEGSACEFNTGSVREDACHGELSCGENSGDVAKGARHVETACGFNQGSVGEGACHGDFACGENAGDVRKAGCIGDRACAYNTGSVGEAACVGIFTCFVNSGAIGKRSCRDDAGCWYREGTVGDNACVGESACQDSGPGAIGRSACRGDRACFNNPGPIAAGACVGPPDPVTGKGICEAQSFNLTRITNTTGGAEGVGGLSINAAGTRIAFMSNRDLTPGSPGNADGDEEIFFFDTTTGLFTQITNTTGRQSGSPSIDATGTRIAFVSNGNLTPGSPGNADGNGEIFLFDTTTSTFTQITNTTGGAPPMGARSTLPAPRSPSCPPARSEATPISSSSTPPPADAR